MSRLQSKISFFRVVRNLVLIAIILIISNQSFGQYRKPPSFWSKLVKDWSINANLGRTSFYGDVSLYDEQFNEKMSKEGSWAFGFGISRKISPIFTLHGEILTGELAGSNSQSTFTSNIKEVTGNLEINLVNMFIPENNARFIPYVKLGMGQFTYDTKLVFEDPNKSDVTTASTSPEFIYLFGGGASYVLTNSFDISIQMMGRRMNNDRIDGSTNKNDDDYYSYLNIGITYKINNVPRDTRYYKRLGMKSPLIRRR
ncbi:MAG: hypothetical protein KDC05_14080 [Bacteroidales bacterium]|nr:hypothetical protein [Bacteroidales bacterium]